MKQKAQAMLKGLLELSGRKEKLTTFLPEALGRSLQCLSVREPFALERLNSSQFFTRIHSSWILALLNTYPIELQATFLAVLPKDISTKPLEELSKEHAVSSNPSPFVRPFLLFTLKQQLQQGEEILEEEQLPPSSLNVLLSFERKESIHLIDLLGLHDLAADLLQIVDREPLAKVHNALSPQQLRFLQYCSKQPIRWRPPKLRLSSVWDGSREHLHRLLHYRGLIRLAKAIHKETVSFRWHLLHRLDTGRARILQKEQSQKQDSTLLLYFKNQVLDIANLINNSRLKSG